MYRLYQAHSTPNSGGPDEEDDGALDPMPPPFYDDNWYENDIPFQVTVQPVGDEPSALDDGSAMAYQREFEDLWRLLEQQALANGWTHIQPQEQEGEEEDEENVEAFEAEYASRMLPGQERQIETQQELPLHETMNTPLRGVVASFESSNNDTPVIVNSHAPKPPPPPPPPPTRHEVEQASGQNPSEAATFPQDQLFSTQPVNDNPQIQLEPPVPSRRMAVQDDPGPPLMPAARAAAARMNDPGPGLLQHMEQWQTPPRSLTETRAKYISAGIIKPSKNTPLGLEVKVTRDGAIEIETILPHGFIFVSGTPLKVGDHITGIKTSKASFTCGHIGGMSKNELLRLLRRSTGRLTIIAENPTGDDTRIECMTAKPHPEFGTGIFFVSGTAAESTTTLQIHSVPSNGLFANSLLHRGAKVVSINGVDCSELDACIATDIVKSAPRYVNIVCQASRRRSTVDNPAEFLRSVPEVEERRPSFGAVFRRRGNGSNPPTSAEC